MRVVLDTNILVSALLVHLGHPAAIYRAWQEGYFALLICGEQLDDTSGLLALERHKNTQIISASDFAALFA